MVFNELPRVVAKSKGFVLRNAGSDYLHILDGFVARSSSLCRRRSGQRGWGRPFGRGHGTGAAVSPGGFRRLHQVWRTIYKKCIFWFLCLSLTLYFIYLLKASLPCSGSVMQTRGHTVLPIDCTPSLVLYTLLWWGFLCLHDFFVQLKKKKVTILIAFSFFSIP